LAGHHGGLGEVTFILLITHSHSTVKGSEAAHSSAVSISPVHQKVLVMGPIIWTQAANLIFTTAVAIAWALAFVSVAVTT
jgi:polyferredoxin